VQQALQNLHCSIASSQLAAAQQLLANLNLAFELHQQSAEAAAAALRVQAVQLGVAQHLAQQLQERLLLAEQQVQQEVQQRLSQQAAAAAVQQALKDAQEKVEQATMCQICFEQPRDTVLMPCMHFLYCAGCVRKGVEQAAAGKDGGALRCPVCRAPVSGQVVVHLSPG
jgi:flagellar motor protein MotB